MEQLISNKSRRILKILNYVLVERKAIYVSDVMQINQCSKKTAYNDLDEIRIKFNLNLYDFDYDNPQNKLNVYQFMKMKNVILTNETAIQLLIELYKNPYQDTLNLSIAINKSESRTRTLLLHFKKFLSIHRILLLKNEAGEYYLEAEDDYILSLFFSELFKMVTYIPINSGEVSFMNRKDFNNLSYYEREIKMIEIVHNEFEDFEEKNTGFEKELLDYKEEVKNNFEKQRKSIDQFLLENNIVLDEKINDLYNIFAIIFMKQKLQPVRVNSLLNRYDYFYVDAKKERNEAVVLFDEFYKLVFSEKFDVFSYKEELFFHLYNTLDLFKIMTKLEIGVFSDMGFDHIYSLCKELSIHFQVHDIKIYSPNKEFDLIISTCEIVKPSSLVVYIDDFISPLDIQQIYTAINQIQLKKN